jgi:hypothetical protein
VLLPYLLIRLGTETVESFATFWHASAPGEIAQLAGDNLTRRGHVELRTGNSFNTPMQLSVPHHDNITADAIVKKDV